MDFFQAQDHAYRTTKRLVFYYVAAIVSIVVCIYLVATVAQQYGREPELLLWDPARCLWVSLAVLGIIGLGTAFKLIALRGGGEEVATSLGGRRISPDTRNPKERMLINVVEEMAIASGVRIPAVFILDQEMSINAFAAGFSLDDAVIAVSAGSLNILTRDELQGVVAHEFSHVINGDMRLNLRLIAVVFGIMVLSIIARHILWISSSRSGSKKDNNAAIAIIALAVMVIGYVGVFFGRMIQAAISRQREFLADASAVQFTRNPDGIAGALLKIRASSSLIAEPAAAETSHMFFSPALSSAFSGMFATHPPLDERIGAILPNASLKELVQDLKKRGMVDKSAQPLRAITGHAEREHHRAEASRHIAAAAVMTAVGALSDQAIFEARQLLAQIPEELKNAAHDGQLVASVIFGLLLDDSAEVKEVQLRHIASNRDMTSLYHAEIADKVGKVPQLARLTLFDVCLPTLKQLPKAEIEAIRHTVRQLVLADGTTDVFEFALETLFDQSILHLESASENTRPAYHRLSTLRPELDVILYWVATIDGIDAEEAKAAMSRASAVLQPHGYEIRFSGAQKTDWDAVQPALHKLAQLDPTLKKPVLEAVVAIMAADKVISEAEWQTLRAFCATLGIPVPASI